MAQAAERAAITASSSRQLPPVVVEGTGLEAGTVVEDVLDAPVARLRLEQELQRLAAGECTPAEVRLL